MICVVDLDPTVALGHSSGLNYHDLSFDSNQPVDLNRGWPTKQQRCFIVSEAVLLLDPGVRRIVLLLIER